MFITYHDRSGTQYCHLLDSFTVDEVHVRFIRRSMDSWVWLRLADIKRAVVIADRSEIWRQ